MKRSPFVCVKLTKRYMKFLFLLFFGVAENIFLWPHNTIFTVFGPRPLSLFCNRFVHARPLPPRSSLRCRQRVKKERTTGIYIKFVHSYSLTHSFSMHEYFQKSGLYLCVCVYVFAFLIFPGTRMVIYATVI